MAHSTLKKIDAGRTRFIVGCLDLSNGESILCYPTNRKAYGNLTQLLTLGRRRADKGECILKLTDVVDYAQGQ